LEPPRCVRPPRTAPGPGVSYSLSVSRQTSAAGTPTGARAGSTRCAAPAHRNRGAPVAGPACRSRPGAAAGGPRARVRHRPLDPCPHHHHDRAAYRGGLPPPPGHVWKLLRHRLHYPGCSAPPAARSSATSRPSTAGWPRTGLSIRHNARRRRAVLVSWDESGALLGGGNAAALGMAATLEADRGHSSRPFGRGTPARGTPTSPRAVRPTSAGPPRTRSTGGSSRSRPRSIPGTLFRTNHPILSPIS
jgi:hypothetical protein